MMARIQLLREKVAYRDVVRQAQIFRSLRKADWNLRQRLTDMMALRLLLFCAAG